MNRNPHLIGGMFILIGVAIGIILAAQIRSNPVKRSSSPLEQLQVRIALLESFSSEQELLKKSLAEVEQKRKEAKNLIERRSSEKTLKTLAHFQALADLNIVEGEGVRITLSDHPDVVRSDFSSINEYFVQASDLRDLINALFLKDAQAVAINGKRATPFTPLRGVFDSILIGNFQIAPPYAIEAVGNPTALEEAVQNLKARKIRIFVDRVPEIKIAPVEQSARSLKYVSSLAL